MALLDVKDLRVTFGGLHAVDGLSTSVRKGSIKGIIGPNGAGKTTLFNAIAGIQRPSQGSITLEGQRIETLKPFQRAKLGLARTFQNLQIFPELSLIENVMIGCHPKAQASGFIASMLGTPRTREEEHRIEATAYDKLALLGMADRAMSLAGNLSFGESKLLEIARALAADPKVLMLDEPIAGVPASEQAPIARMIRQVNAQGVTVVLVEHNMRMVMGLCDEILVLRSGRFLAEGTPAEISSNAEVIGAYLGNPIEETVDA
ncbi:Lipopolysaccharide export system ATP-binding protein LptB [Variovorax sp. PBL-H6]|uniref:ABC transporter ATP-binding protein n=1 Tax=Variovorax sp. PBL-H6 TaxID=434009 RepID=UPI00131957B7|nr:ABC transporter ATP-binding protein [Variovorax sp. PBL-H6]VTU23237.1 Lipopolysaccharide export system ATP-binding protein LptB [Variovorax sp. PBL-H6]